jgi:hypothetical protein
MPGTARAAPAENVDEGSVVPRRRPDLPRQRPGAFRHERQFQIAEDAVDPERTQRQVLRKGGGHAQGRAVHDRRRIGEIRRVQLERQAGGLVVASIRAPQRDRHRVGRRGRIRRNPQLSGHDRTRIFVDNRGNGIGHEQRCAGHRGQVHLECFIRFDGVVTEDAEPGICVAVPLGDGQDLRKGAVEILAARCRSACHVDLELHAADGSRIDMRTGT